MTKNSIVRIFTIINMGLMLIFTISCEKKFSEDDPITDTDGNIYKTVKIYDQVWMAENLKTTRYRNGDLIETTSPATKDIFNEISPKYQWAYEASDSILAIYGRLYTWYVVTDNRGLCPDGWHLPADNEWATLIANLGSKIEACDKLRETGTEHWLYPNNGANNKTGFSALPGGFKSPYDQGPSTFEGLCRNGFWWVATEYSPNEGCILYMTFEGMLSYSFADKKFGLSVRCVRDN
jgi:uncharacterized protein (TIGR02145 family)